MPDIKKILVANRGEIALRVMRSARELGIKTVAIFSEADRNALHVRYADEAVCVGPPASAESYLRIEAGIIFIGPSAESIEVMGDKLSAKAAVLKRNVPLVPGLDKAITDIAFAKEKADEIGYPILIKASAGGGGKGMRIVEDPAEFESQMDRAVSEAKNAFGNGAVFIEKFVTSPRHIEIQILGDQKGNVVHLFERECSIQRRHQKVIEEAPSSVLTPEIREQMGQAAIDVAKSCDYYGAGTVEFIVDDQLNFYFLEMNTRLQVEHPVTEQITGVDLVKEQIRIAEGKALSIKQEDLSITGHAVEVRVYAEDPQNNFLPDIGKLKVYKRPQGTGVRVDDGFEQGMDIPIHYDPMIAKLITYADNREEAINRMIRAIDEYEIVGIQTTLSFCKYVLKHEAFTSGNFNTKFIEKHFKPSDLDEKVTDVETKIAAALAVKLWSERQKKQTAQEANGKKVSLWKKNRL